LVCTGRGQSSDNGQKSRKPQKRRWPEGQRVTDTDAAEEPLRKKRDRDIKRKRQERDRQIDGEIQKDSQDMKRRSRIAKKKRRVT
jgi:hypothetical protein